MLEQLQHHSAQIWKDKEVNTIPSRICLKVMSRLEFEPAYNEVAVLCISNYLTGTP